MIQTADQYVCSVHHSIHRLTQDSVLSSDLSTVCSVRLEPVCLLCNDDNNAVLCGFAPAT